MFSLGEFESKLNEALERNSILEMELDDKDELAETVQRLRDEARDLKQEIAVRQQKAQKEIITSHHNHLNNNIITTTSASDMDTATNTTTPMDTHTPAIPATAVTNSSALNTILNELQLISQAKSSIAVATAAANHFQTQTQTQPQQAPPITPSTRISALNFVGDALRKVTVSCIPTSTRIITNLVSF